ncbi:MAG TPA: 2-dehydropantoate 2-reductase [Gemmatimonadaceae bacterium]|nr:2-dehydropantoate 2-reductase [Gemmatimonadaceae bacterium]
MRILVVGAGAIGGYFGARLLQAGRDVTFLVRPRRAAQLSLGLSVESPVGDIQLPGPPTVTSDAVRDAFDLVVLSCKAYDLDGAIDAFAPAVGPDTAILPLLNGMRHLDVLGTRFGPDRVLGGQCVISAALGPDGRILHLNELQSLTFGEQDGRRSARAAAIDDALSGARFDVTLSETIIHDMWEKWVFIAAAAGITCLMRATIGDIVAVGGADLAHGLLDECARIAGAAGFPPRNAAIERSRATLGMPGSPLTASMLRDVERGARTEMDHVLGDLLRRGGTLVDHGSVLRIAHAHLAAYETRREREARARRADVPNNSTDPRG